MAAIEFTLFAPYNNQVALKGDFSNWEDIPMEKGKDGIFRTQIDLRDGTYQYKFRVQSKSWFLEPNTWVDIVDPYATGIDNASQNGIIRIKGGDRIVDTYVWQHDNVPLPSDRNLIIYEMHVGDFSGGESDPYPRGQFEHVVEKLDYLVELGINAIELMPVLESPGDHSWGYTPRHFFAPENSYGTSADLKRLIDECHGRGIRVIFDAVLNHADAEMPLTQIDYDYWFHHEARDPDNNWGPEFNYELWDEKLDTYPARWFAYNWVKYWIEEYHIDGLRYDAARQLANYDFMTWIVNETKELAGSKPFFNIAEHIPENPAITNADGPMDSCWHTAFYYAVRDVVVEGNYDAERLKEALEPCRHGYASAVNVVNYLSNHDQDRLLVHLGEQEILGEAAFRRVQLGMAFLMTAVGLPMLWMGEEFGEYKPKTIDPAKLDWHVLGNDKNRRLFEYVKGLTHLRQRSPALCTDNIDFFHDDPECKVLAYVRWHEEGTQVVVIANCSEHYLKDYTVNCFPQSGTWHEWTHNFDIEVEGDDLTLDLPEYEAKVLVWGDLG